MKFYHLFFLIIISLLILFTSCQKNNLFTTPDAHPCYILTEHKDSTVHFSLWDASWVEENEARTFVMPNGGMIVPYESEPPYNPRKAIKTEIVIDSNIGTTLDSNTLAYVDTILKKLYIGIELVEISQSNNKSLANIQTTETLNSDNILKELKKAQFDDEKELHIYLFNHSEFFNTSNAFAFQSGKDKIILGNKDLFNSSLLFVHELGHAFGLGHFKEQYNSKNSKQNSPNQKIKDNDVCGLFNIMHESNIGCALLFDPQQALIVGRDDSYISFHKNTTNKFPIIDKENKDCKCNTKHYKTKMEKYINSKDRSIDGEKLVGVYSEVTTELLEEITSKKINILVKRVFIENFKVLSDILFYTQSEKDSFVKQSIKGLTQLRRNNLIRLIGHNVVRRKRSLESEFSWDDLFLNPDTLEYYMDIYPTEITSHPLMSKSICDTLLTIKEGSINLLENEIKDLQDEIDSLIIYKKLYAKCTIKLDSLDIIKELYAECETDLTTATIFERLYNICKKELDSIANFEELYFGCKTELDSIKAFEELYFGCEADFITLRTTIFEVLDELKNTDDKEDRIRLISEIIGLLIRQDQD